MFVMILMLTMLYEATTHPAPCTEDTQCFSGFYCEESAHSCRECLRCDQLRREAARQPAGFCVKTIGQCGPCLEGYDNGSAECDAFDADAGAPHAYLPAYGWAAVALGLLLMIITLAVFLKTKTFRLFDYSSRTSVQSVHAAGPAARCRPLSPPPYNHILPFAFAPSSPQPDAPEIQRLIDAPEPRKQPLPEQPPGRAREAASSQAARVYSHPAYVRGPQTLDSFKTPDEPLSPPVNDESGDVMTSPGLDVTAVELSGSNSKLEDNHNATNVHEDNTNYEVISLGRGKDQDSNNNGSSAGGPRSPGAQRGACVIGGPSFVINVVENISHVAHFTRSDTS